MGRYKIIVGSAKETEYELNEISKIVKIKIESMTKTGNTLTTLISISD